jgi:hypothetical protein
MKQSLDLLAACLALLTANASAADLTIGFIYVGPKDEYGTTRRMRLARPASQFPKIQFFHCGGFYIPGKHQFQEH